MVNSKMQHQQQHNQCKQRHKQSSKQAKRRFLKSHIKKTIIVVHTISYELHDPTVSCLDLDAHTFDVMPASRHIGAMA
jgi:hypothetical protein